MSAFDIAVAVRKDHDSDTEELKAFLLRRFAKARMSDVGDALNLLIGWERAYEEVEKLVVILRPVAAKEPDATIDALIERKRKLGYDAALEALLARRWRCPHCKQFAHVNNIELPIGDPDRLPRCMTCGEEGIAPMDGEAKIKVHDGGKSGLRPV